ncbi:uncharacterized protein LOC129789254 [Lutzomyia longipalpis]|uniref:uncharacterized protein LOC129789254 n=1 Tax=Lutzomyia longipalpis TaxID=7200 RepID=UPI002483C346|nr:uncharacterized protein LOC129789254 [Lutzomyia longipalpis]
MASNIPLSALERNQRANVRELTRIVATLHEASTKSLAKWTALRSTLEEVKAAYISTQMGIFQWNAGNDAKLALYEKEYADNLDHISEAMLFVREKVAELSLTGDAAKSVQHVKITDDNYQQLWDSLQDQYGKKSHIVNECIEKFLAQPKMKEGSLQALKDLTVNSKRIIWELKNMGNEYYNLDSWLIYLMKNLMDEDTRKSWEEKRVDSDLASIDDWFAFLDKRIDAMELWAPKGTISSGKQEKKPQPKGTVKSHHTETLKCPKCSSSHQLFQCDAFKAMTLPDKRRFAFAQKVCYNCLRTNHISEKCPSKSTCRECNQKHHTMLHPSDAPKPQTPPAQPAEAPVPASSITSHHMSAKNRVLLPTALVKVADKHGNQQECRILVDTGGECTFISEACAQRLGLPRRNGRLGVNGPGEVTVAHTKGLVSLVLSSIHDPGEHIQADAYVLSKLTSMFPGEKIVEPKSWQHLKTLQLADPTFGTPGTIDIILGGDYALAINLPQILHSETGVPVAQLTIFGWILGGKIGGQAAKVTSFHTSVNLDAALTRFWEHEDVPHPKAKFLSEEEQFVEKHFVENVKRLDSGRYEVHLPFKPNHPDLGNSKAAALQRLRVMEKKFTREPIFQQSYVDFMKEYLEMGHMELVAAEECFENAKSYFIPHMAVLRPSSTTTKLRVVFDASARTKPTNVSLNDILAIGPTIQQDLVSTLLKFRTYRYAFAADIEKMYRQVSVALPDRDYQLILWRDSIQEAIRTYRLTTVTYGTACAPYLATRVLQQIALDNEKDFPEASHAIQMGFYMDDLLYGADTVESAMQLMHDIHAILARSGFRLRKWSSNSSAVLNEIPPEDLAVSPADVDNCSKSISTLGLQWSPGSDTLALTIEKIPPVTTKRELCSAVAKIFDPLGIISPVTSAMKMIFQQLWLCDADWNDSLPNAIIDEFNFFRDEIECLTEVKLPRFIPHGDVMELHGFSDASEKGIGAVIYVRGCNQDDETTVRLLIAKARVAPLKPTSIPRLELCAALLLAKLFEKVKEVFSSRSIAVTAWSDSAVVLHWLHHHPSRWKTYVANRCAEILDIVPAAQWRHIASADNPADCISRGLTPKELNQHHLWWTGPPWLVQDSEQWPPSLIDLPSSLQTGEEKPPKVTSHLATPPKTLELFHKYSSVSTLIRIVAYVLRWKRKYQGEQLKGQLSVQELDNARHCLIKIVQSEGFPDELKHLQKGQQMKSGSKLRSLVPFLDSEGIIRVTGRIQNSELGPETRHPILLPGKHPFTLKLIENVHLSHLHSGQTLTQSILRARYWIIGERTSVKSVIHKCIPCFKAKPKPETPMMGNLPKVRVTADEVFNNVGIDYAGPIRLRSSNLRKAPTLKGYICLFICMATKAIHLEAVSDMSTEAFKAALARFTGRRGHPAPDDFEALTPGHFIALRPLTQPPSPNYLNTNPNRLTRWKYLQRLSQEYWKRWHSEYVTSLQQRPKWQISQRNLQPGDLVLVKTDNLSSGDWELGRIVEVHVGSQGAVRAATVNIKGSISCRAVNKMAKLPMDSNPEMDS